MGSICMKSLENQPEKPNQNLEFIREMSWPEALEIWRANEADLEHWVTYCQERGHASWEGFRAKAISRMNLEKRRWKLFSIPDPTGIIPQFYAGPFKGWVRDHFKGRDFTTIAEIADSEKVKNHSVIQEIRNNFPKNTSHNRTR